MNILKANILTALFAILLLISCKTTNKVGEPKVVQNMPEKVMDSDKAELDHSLLWKITGNGLEKPSYLYGTIHMIHGEDFFLPSGTLAAIDESERMVFEIDMKQMSDMSNLMGLMEGAFMKDNLTIQDLLSEEDMKLVEAHFEKLGLPIFMFQRMKPMFLTVFASGDMSPEDLQSGKIKSYEMEFMEMADDSNMETGGLETIEFQMSVFDQIPYKEQADMLMETIKMGDQEDDTFKVLIEAYKSQDLERMLNLSMSEEGGLSEYDDILLNQRNINWIPQMAEMMAEKQNFFAVGAGHLGGEQGVIKLLRKEGYSVEAFGKK